MGNCQVAAVEMTEIQHPEGKVERIYCSMSASHISWLPTLVTTSAAVILASPHARNSESNNAINNTAEKYLKLLPPDDTLLLGNVYRLVTFEEVLREFRSNRSVKLSCLLMKFEKPLHLSVLHTDVEWMPDDMEAHEETRSETGEIKSETK